MTTPVTSTTATAATATSGWDAYTTLLINSKCVTYAAIIGLDGNIWANSSPTQLKITADEIKEIVEAFTNPAPIRCGGLVVGSYRHIALACDNQVLQGKRGAGGITVAKTNKAIIIGIYATDSGIQAGAASDVVQKLAIQLQKQGY